MIRGWSFIITIIINKRLVKNLIILGLLVSISLNVYSYIQNNELSKNYESLVCITNQLDKACLIAFISSRSDLDNRYGNIEIFDISKGEVIKSIISNSSMQKEAVNYLKGISGMYVKINAIPDKGYIIRIPLDPPQKVQNKWLNDYGIQSVNEVFVIFYNNEKPYLLVLDNRARPFFYEFKGNTDKLVKYIGIVL